MSTRVINKDLLKYGISSFLIFAVLFGLWTSRNIRGWFKVKVLKNEVTLNFIDEKVRNELPVGSSWARVDKFLNDNHIEHSRLITNPVFIQPVPVAKTKVIMKNGKRVPAAATPIVKTVSTVYGLIKGASWKPSQDVHVALEFTFDEYNNLKSYKVRNSFSDIK